MLIVAYPGSNDPNNRYRGVLDDDRAEEGPKRPEKSDKS